jgi:hypothetical protein
MITGWPACASETAIAAPMPRPPPVTRARVPARLCEEVCEEGSASFEDGGTVLGQIHAQAGLRNQLAIASNLAFEAPYALFAELDPRAHEERFAGPEVLGFQHQIASRDEQTNARLPAFGARA